MYKITIEEIKPVEITKDGEWITIEKRPYTPKELADSGNPEYFKDKLKEIRGCAPDKKAMQTRSHETYNQTVDTLDLHAVIIAVNGLNPNNQSQQ